MSPFNSSQYNALLDAGRKLWDNDLEAMEPFDSIDDSLMIVARLVLPGTGMCWEVAALFPNMLGVAFGLSHNSLRPPTLGYIDLGKVFQLTTKTGLELEVDSTFPTDCSLLEYQDWCLKDYMRKQEGRLLERLVKARVFEMRAGLGAASRNRGSASE